ncbi:MAG: hypothetical protein J5633_05575 [Oscillospiraceae bacterium]|nr:hypothetical protein [Oscillospiraceae bacterium]MBR4132415.1 hypothetical protein [Oscillospiraceae bacterium]
MNRTQKKEIRQRQSTRQLMGIDRLTDYSVKTPKGELVFFLVRPDNLSVLSGEGIGSRVRALMELLRGTEVVTLRAMDSRESFEQNKIYYLQRMEEESNPAIRSLLRKDRAYLDEIQTLTASAREFAFVYSLERQGNESVEAQLTRMEKDIRDRGFHVRVARDQDLKRLLAVYYQQDVTTEYFESIDGERTVSDNAENDG